MRKLLSLLIMVTPWVVMADQEQQAIEELEDSLAPKVTITRDQQNLVEEYRMNGQLYMIKITPSKGLPYYLVDADGDGLLESRRNELAPDVMVPSWVLFRW